jgi:hypothetical protein
MKIGNFESPATKDVWAMKRKKEARLTSRPKSEPDSLAATVETLENEYIIEQLEKSEQDILHGRVRNAKAFLKELQ